MAWQDQVFALVSLHPADDGHMLSFFAPVPGYGEHAVPLPRLHWIGEGRPEPGLVGRDVGGTTVEDIAGRGAPLGEVRDPHDDLKAVQPAGLPRAVRPYRDRDAGGCERNDVRAH